MTNTIYAEDRYLEGKLLCEKFIMKHSGVMPFGDDVWEYHNIGKMAEKLRNSCLVYQNLQTEEIQSEREGTVLRRPLTIRELECLARNSTEKRNEE